MNWYYVDGSKKVGPVTQTDIELLVKNGKIASDTLVWNENIAKWQSYDKLEGVMSASIPPMQKSNIGAISDNFPGISNTDKAGGKSSSLCAECGRTFPVDEMVQYAESTICAACKPIFFQRLKEGLNLPNTMLYAGFWIRFGAKFIDGIITGLVNMVFSFLGGFVTAMNYSPGTQQAVNPGNTFVVFGVVYILQLIFSAAYATFFIGKFGATPGKMACSLKVVIADGGTVSYSRALGRHFAEILSGIILLIGYIMAAFDDEKRALHDRICNTRVIKK